LKAPNLADVGREVRYRSSPADTHLDPAAHPAPPEDPARARQGRAPPRNIFAQPLRSVRQAGIPRPRADLCSLEQRRKHPTRVAQPAGSGPHPVQLPQRSPVPPARARSHRRPRRRLRTTSTHPDSGPRKIRFFPVVGWIPGSPCEFATCTRHQKLTTKPPKIIMNKK